MRIFSAIIIFVFLSHMVLAQVRTIHVFVALCDNEHQGIVPVPKTIGNGKDPYNNLYWGAGYGVKTFFKNKTSDWQLVSVLESNNPNILERLLFRHKSGEVYMLADAYDGEKIKDCIEDFLQATNAQQPVEVNLNSSKLKFGGDAQMVAYIGHNGLMDFDVSIDYTSAVENPKDVIILACYSKNYFSEKLNRAKANPILWTTHLMAPEAYTLKSAIDGWINNETGAEIKERAAQTYHKYQKCGITGARNLFTTGF